MYRDIEQWVIDALKGLNKTRWVPENYIDYFFALGQQITKIPHMGRYRDATIHERRKAEVYHLDKKNGKKKKN